MLLEEDINRFHIRVLKGKEKTEALARFGEEVIKPEEAPVVEYQIAYHLAEEFERIKDDEKAQDDLRNKMLEGQFRTKLHKLLITIDRPDLLKGAKETEFNIRLDKLIRSYESSLGDKVHRIIEDALAEKRIALAQLAGEPDIEARTKGIVRIYRLDFESGEFIRADSKLLKGMEFIEENKREVSVDMEDCVIIELNPDEQSAYTNRARAYYSTGRHDMAIADFTKIIALNPASTDAYAGRGSCYFAKKEYDNALNDFQKAKALGAQIDPKVFELLHKKLGAGKQDRSP